jgi:hypothetical protein
MNLNINGDKCSTDKEIADIFADTFSDNFTNTDNSGDFLPRKKTVYNSKLDSIIITPSMVNSVLSNFRANNSAGSDDIPPRILHDCSAALRCSLSALFNLSVRLGTLPSEWKLANVTPIYKSGKIVMQKIIDQYQS